MKKSIAFLLLTFLATAVSSQSVFRAFPKIGHISKSLAMAPGSVIMTEAWRFTGPMGGYLYSSTSQSQVVTGLGFGYSKMKWIDTTGKWYTTLSVNAVAFAGGNIAPTLQPFTVISVGVSLGLL